MLKLPPAEYTFTNTSLLEKYSGYAWQDAGRTGMTFKWYIDGIEVADTDDLTYDFTDYVDAFYLVTLEARGPWGSQVLTRSAWIQIEAEALPDVQLNINFHFTDSPGIYIGLREGFELMDFAHDTLSVSLTGTYNGSEQTDTDEITGTDLDDLDLKFLTFLDNNLMYVSEEGRQRYAEGMPVTVTATILIGVDSSNAGRTFLAAVDSDEMINIEPPPEEISLDFTGTLTEPEGFLATLGSDYANLAEGDLVTVRVEGTHQSDVSLGATVLSDISFTDGEALVALLDSAVSEEVLDLYITPVPAKLTNFMTVNKISSGTIEGLLAGTGLNFESSWNANSNPGSAWIKYTFEHSGILTNYGLRSYRDGLMNCADWNFPSTIVLAKSNDNVTWETVQTDVHDPGWWGDYWYNHPVTDIVPAKYWRVLFTTSWHNGSGGVYHITRFRMYGMESDTDIDAPAMFTLNPAQLTANAEGSGTLANTINEPYNGSFSWPVIDSTNRQGWIAYDFLEPKTITTYSILSTWDSLRNAATYNFPSIFDLQKSADGVTWETVQHTDTNNSNLPSRWMDYGVTAPVAARYWRLLFSKTAYAPITQHVAFDIAGLRLYGR